MLNLGVIPVDVTARFYFSTAAADGGEENFSATLEEADIVVMKDGSAMTLDASTITITNITTGVYEVDIDQTNDSDFTAGSTYWLTLDPDETIDSQTVSAVIGCWSTETASQRAVRLLQSRLYPGAVISTTTSNGVAAINLTDIVDAQTDNDSLIGQLLMIRDATDGALIWATITDLTSLVATVELFPNGGNMPITVASGDEVYIMGPVYTHALGTQAKADVNAEADTALSDYDPPTNAEMVARTLAAASYFDPSTDTVDVGAISGDSTAADNLESAFDGTGYDLGGIDVSELNAIVDDLLNGGRLDLLIDAIKTVTDALGSTAAAKLALSTVGIVTGSAATGTLNTTTATTDLTGYADDQFIGRVLVVTSGAAEGEATDITDYAETNGTLTFTALTTAMGNGDTFCIV